MEAMTIKELLQFIENNKSELNNDSTVLMVTDDNSGFVKHQGFLNVTGHFDWELENGEFIDGDYGDVLTIWTEPNSGKITYGEKSNNIARDHEDFFANFMFDGRGSVPRNVRSFESELIKMRDNGGNEDALVTGLLDHRGDTPFAVIKSVKIDDNLKLNYSDSYGHSVEKSPKFPMLILEMGMSFKQTFNPDKNKNENKVQKYDEYLKENILNLFKKPKNSDIVNTLKELGIALRSFDDEVYRTYPKNGFEFCIASGSDSYDVRTSYYGTQYKKDLIVDLKEYIEDTLLEKPNIVHKFNYETKGKKEL